MEINHWESLFSGSVEDETGVEEQVTAIGILQVRHFLFPLNQITIL